jgi:hypothetical protein
MKTIFFNNNTGEKAYVVPQHAGGLTSYKYTVTFLGKKGKPFNNLSDAIKWLNKKGYN